MEDEIPGDYTVTDQLKATLIPGSVCVCVCQQAVQLTCTHEAVSYEKFGSKALFNQCCYRM